MHKMTREQRELRVQDGAEGSAKCCHLPGFKKTRWIALIFFLALLTLYLSQFGTITSNIAMRLPTSTHFGVTAVIALFWQVSLGLCLVSAIYDDGNQILNRDLDPAIFHRLGQYAPRYSVRSSPTHPPKGCKIQVVNSLERHGARLMTSGAFSRTDATLKKIQSALARSASPDLPPELAFLKEVALLSETTSLVPYGALQ